MKALLNKIILMAVGLLALIILNRCNFDYGLTDSITTDKLLASKNGLEEICTGNLALMKALLTFQGQGDGGNNIYIRQYFYNSEFASDNVVCGQSTPDPLYLSFTYEHNPTQIDVAYFWWVSYKIIASANTVISMYEQNQISNLDKNKLQMIGENYFIRAFCYFSLLNFHAKQYAIDSLAPGVPLRITNLEGQNLKRSPVNECYRQIRSDLLAATGLMTPETSRGMAYPSIGAAYAFLSRVYLYMNDYDNTILYANKVIGLNTYSIDPQFATYYPRASEGSPETIWCLKFQLTDDIGKFGSLSSMYNGDGGWGEEFASDPLRELYKARPWDTRGSYIDTVFADTAAHTGFITTAYGIRRVYVTKFSYQDGKNTLTSPVFFRISEVYLNRAEAYAKKGMVTEALNDLDAINQKRGYTSDKLYNGVVPASSSVLAEVLLVRRMELAFEGHRKFDLLRNKINLDRQYWGCHIPNLVATDVNYNTVPAKDDYTYITFDDPRNLFYIPVQETSLNSLCEQNP